MSCSNFSTTGTSRCAAGSPRAAANPFYDDYTHLLGADDYFRFTPPGIAVGEHRESESQRLGRIVARGYLAQHHGYRWFASIDDLLKAPQRDWAALPLAKGNKPDWLVTRKGSAAVAEAKGTHRLIHNGSKSLPAWRIQAGNVRITKDGKSRGFKTWIVASRWVTTAQPRTLPRIYVEDPPLEGKVLGEHELNEIELWTARAHTAQNLGRLGVDDVAARMVTDEPVESPASRRVRWRCVLPELKQRSFVGRFVGNVDSVLAVLASAWWPAWDFPERRASLDVLHQLMLEMTASLKFDGLDVATVKSLLRHEVPSEPEVRARHEVSFLSDGSLLAPATLMRPDGVIEF